MISTKLIKNRIKSVKNIKKVTKSMELIAAVKFQKTVDRSAAITRFRNDLVDLKSLIAENEEHLALFAPSPEAHKELLIVFSSDRGLCGGFNSNVRKEVTKWLAGKDPQNIEVIAYGKVVAKYIKARGVALSELYTAPEAGFTVEFIKQTVAQQIKQYKAGELKSITLMYTQFHSMLRQEVVSQTVLPVNVPEVPVSQEEQTFSDELIEPDLATVMERLLAELVQTEWYSALINSLASENVARMVAMKNASDASGEVISILTLDYNKARQAAITQEITEIVAGMDSLQTRAMPTSANSQLNYFSLQAHE